jgi:hypothetical protein
MGSGETLPSRPPPTGVAAASVMKCKTVPGPDPSESAAMPLTVACEYCEKPVQREHAVVDAIEEWSHYFCSEACKLAWEEQSALEADEDL